MPGSRRQMASSTRWHKRPPGSVGLDTRYGWSRHATFRTIPCPSYPEIRIAVRPHAPARRAASMHSGPRPLHIATEGPLGFSGATLLHATGTALHDLLPHAVPAVSALTLADPAVAFLSSAALVSRCCARLYGQHAKRYLGAAGPWLPERRALAAWRGHRVVSAACARTSCSCRGRWRSTSGVWRSRKMWKPSSACRWHGSKIVIGDGPQRARLQPQYPDAHYLGFRFGEDLA